MVGIEADGPDTFAVWDLQEPYIIDPENFRSKGRATPFSGWRVCGRALMTFVNGRPVWTAAGSRR